MLSSIYLLRSRKVKQGLLSEGICWSPGWGCYHVRLHTCVDVHPPYYGTTQPAAPYECVCVCKAEVHLDV